MEKINESNTGLPIESNDSKAKWKVWYEDTEKLKIVFTTLVISVDSINRVFGPLNQFAKQFTLTGYTNGKLFLMAEMMSNPIELERLIVNHLEPMGMVYGKDMQFTYDQPSYDVIDAVYPDMNKELPECKSISWLGSEISSTGCNVWLIKNA